MLNVDEKIGDWVADVLKPSKGKILEDIIPQDYMMEKRVLGLAFRAIDMKILNEGHTRVTSCIWKDWKEKKELK